MSFIPYGRQNISQEDIAAVVDVLGSDYLTQGPKVPLFEASVAEYCKAEHAIAFSSATAALHIACLSLGIGSGDKVWTTPITFVASANCALYCGAQIDFVDIDPKTYNMSTEFLAEKLHKASLEGNLPKAVIVVHMCGQPCDMRSVYELSIRYGFKIIEDASHGIGSQYQGFRTGSCTYSDITVFSFHPVKIITTGEGGVALTNNKHLAKKMALLRSHGITRDASEMFSEPEGEWYYEQIDLGFNYRMTDIHAALGLSQMQRLEEFIHIRHQLAEHYAKELACLPLTTPFLDKQCLSSFHLYVIRLNLSVLKRTKAEIFRILRDLKIGINLHYIPVYHHPYYQKMGFTKGYCKEAEQYYLEAISLPIYSHLTSSDQQRVIDTLRKEIF